MTIREALKRYRDIEKEVDDDERAHGMEDDFRRDILQAIADGAPDAVRLAKIALQTAKLEFARWCA